MNCVFRVSDLRRLTYLSGVALVLTSTCRRESPPGGAFDATGIGGRGSLVVEWAGCAGIRKGPVCEMGRERKLTIWIGGAGRARWPVVTDRGPVPAKAEADIDGGSRLTVDVPAGARRVEIRDAEGRAQWSLSLGEAKVHDEIERLVAVGRTGKYEDALRGLEALRPRARPDERGPTDAAIGRMALALGKVDRAEPAFRSSIAAAKADGRINDVMKDSLALLWAFVHLQQRYAEARALLEEMTPIGEGYPEGRVWLDYHAGLLASDTADVRTALQKYRAAERGARRLGWDSMAEEATMEVARLLARIGRAEEAVALLKPLPTAADACARATRALNLVWALMERAAQRESHEDVSEEASAIAATQAATRECPDPHRRLLATVYAAEHALKIQDDAEAGRLVQELETAAPERDILRASRRAEVLGRWFLRQRKPAAALGAFDRELPAARAGGLVEEAFRGEVGAGRALLALGRRAEAVSRLRMAQKELGSMLRGIPLGEGRGSFLGGHDDGVRYLVEALVDVGALREALRAARWARAAELAHTARLDRLAHLAPDARRGWDEALGRYQRIRGEIEREAENDWTFPRSEIARRRSERQTRAEQARTALDDAYRLLIEGGGPRDVRLSDPAPGEVFLSFFPAPRGWFVFAATPSGVSSRRIEEVAFSSPTEAASVLALFGRQLADARRVRLFPYGAADRVDWQAASWRGRPLISSMQVEYGLDVGTESNPDQVAKSAPMALVVSDPSGDLPAARPEAVNVVGALRGLKEWKVTHLDGSMATRASMLAALPQARLFHYAGHAQQSGSQGLSSALLLNGGSRVELGDLLAAPSLPALVFLSACEAAGTGTIERQPSLMGLAQAFIAAGSRVAIAPTRPIRDEDARVFVAAFYAAFVRSSPSQGGNADKFTDAEPVEYVREAFRSAALEVFSQRLSQPNVPVQEREDGQGWESIRLLVP
jgi:tetratricopeptide (TPR) repeat protein